MVKILIRDGTVIPFDGTQKIIEKGYVAIDGEKISSVGKIEDVPQADYDEIIDAEGGAILPGFVNAHTHVATECFRGIADVFPNMSFTFVVKDFIEEEHLHAISRLGCLELIRFGTTCTGDNYQRSRIVAKAIAETGMRGVVSEQIHQADIVSGVYPSIFKYQPEEADAQIKANEKLIDEWHGAKNGRITCAFGPHAPDTLTQEILKEVNAKAEERDVGIMIHIAQSTRELDVMRTRHRMTSVEYLQEVGTLGPRTVAAHCVYLTPKDISILRDTGTHIAHCPNNFIRRGLPTPLMPWLKGGVKNIGLASDNILHDPFEIMRITNWLALQYVKQKDPESLHLVPTPFETMEMATIGSARALGLGGEVGSLEVGKKADVIVVDLKKPHLTPTLHLPANLVHYANGNDVETVIIDGEMVMKDRVIRTIDEEKVLAEGQKASEEIWSSFNRKYPQFPEVAAKFKYFT
jgi:5-methylthioadenosine/S-adenosylhomocysteine deaminase